MKKLIIFAILFSYTAISSAQSANQNQLLNQETKTKLQPENQSSSSIFPEMVDIQGGTFSMGSNVGEPDEKPVHAVTISNFKMGKFEITYKEFAKFIEASGYKTDAEKIGYSHIFTYQFEERKGITWQYDEEGKKRLECDNNKPVIHVSWYDAIAYCTWLSKFTGKTYRLPSEAEWEYAAGNGVKHTKYSWGNNLPAKEKPSETAKNHSKKNSVTCSSKFDGNKNGCFFSDNVGSYLPNELGLYDMSGNVWEWCNDRYGKDYYKTSASKDPKGPTIGENRVIRGASWVYFPENGRVSYRSGANPTLTNYNIGFRVVCQE